MKLINIAGIAALVFLVIEVIWLISHPILFLRIIIFCSLMYVLIWTLGFVGLMWIGTHPSKDNPNISAQQQADEYCSSIIREHNRRISHQRHPARDW